MKLYERLAEELAALITQCVFQPGERLPSVRQSSQQHRLSITTVLHAYMLLESRGLIESRPKSGYFVSSRTTQVPVPRLAQPGPQAISAEVDVSSLVLSTLRSIRIHDAVPLGSPYPDPSQFPWKKINQYATGIARKAAAWSVIDDLPPGNPELIRQIARRYLENGLAVDPNEIVITIGATEAINLCLQAVAKPGDTIAVESPTYYAMLHAIERLGMRAIEIPTDIYEGIDLEALEFVTQQQAIAACMVMPNFQNPMGFQMSDARKRQLVALLAKQKIPIIENAVYDELYYGRTPPSSLKSYDSQGLVLHCSSFSKSLSASYRIGWALPGNYRAQVEKLKFLNTLTTASVPQLALAEYLKQDGFDRHLRRLRKTYAQNAAILSALVLRFFPLGTEISKPTGGYVLWVALPGEIDTILLYQRALENKITIGPGRMFSTSNRFKHCIRLNYSYPWSAELEAAVILLSRLVFECSKSLA